ncbi:3'(2'),5'-bisphosphate nucleotidase CysQ [Duganella sp. Root198D2]|uniref:3'(2'),5'-bisphosphate nucleotidase CysQ n=1 Tax=Duganella sp. Root198D2 TaxID=1736489 RepID=UPI00070D94F0|nr:3'(2'),5'-bisphosphate nucleotidase CysQ [Duganella sp. Root198D2]KRB83406.1 3'(2'),5'-bisphosphate nucleotidase CysQ [Duganella sp. Root198D2]
MRQKITDDLMQAVVALAQNAGDAIMDIYQAGALVWTEKGDSSPLCQADLQAHAILVAGLAELAPGILIVSEEDGDAAPARPIGGQFWLIDPLDGTKEFISRNDEFTINVALVEDGRPVLGVVLAPALNLAYWGAGGIGAFRADATGTSTIHVAQGLRAGPLRVVASKSHLNEETQEFITGLGPCELVQAGSSLKICRIAEGVADIYPRLGPTCEWDTAAAQAVLEAAGGTVLSVSGQALCYGKPEVLNPFFIASAPGCYLPKTQ